MLWNIANSTWITLHYFLRRYYRYKVPRIFPSPYRYASQRYQARNDSGYHNTSKRRETLHIILMRLHYTRLIKTGRTKTASVSNHIITSDSKSHSRLRVSVSSSLKVVIIVLEKDMIIVPSSVSHNTGSNKFESSGECSIVIVRSEFPVSRCFPAVR